MNAPKPVEVQAAQLLALNARDFEAVSARYVVEQDAYGMQALRHIATTTPVTYAVTPGHVPQQTKYTFRLPQRSSNALHVARSDHLATITSTYVLPQMRGMGAGTRLYRSAAAQLKAEGVDCLYSIDHHRRALKWHAKIMGTAALAFYWQDYPELRLENVQYAQALAVATAVENGTNPNPHTVHFGVFVDLAQLDTRGWRLPTPATPDNSGARGQ